MYVLADYHKACGVIAELPTGQQELQRCAQRSSAGSWCGLTCNLYRARSLPSVTKHAGGTCSSGAGMQLRGGVYRLSLQCCHQSRGVLMGCAGRCLLLLPVSCKSRACLPVTMWRNLRAEAAVSLLESFRASVQATRPNGRLLVASMTHTSCSNTMLTGPVGLSRVGTGMAKAHQSNFLLTLARFFYSLRLWAPGSEGVSTMLPEGRTTTTSLLDRW